MIIECACGCGKEITIKHMHKYIGIPKFIRGHSMKTKEYKERHSERMKANHPRGMLGKHHTKEVKERIGKTLSKKFKGKNNPFYGKKHSKEQKDKWSKERSGDNNPSKRLDVREKLSKALSGKNNPMYGMHAELNPNWKGGISFEPYPPEFNGRLKNKIKNRDNHTCQLCGDNILSNTLKKRLCVHHINYDKRDCREENLISLCNFCNSSANASREEWTQFFQEKLSNGVINHSKL